VSGDADKDAFLARWSRRKVAARRGDALPEPAVPPAPPVPAQTETPSAAATQPPPAEGPPELPSLDTLKGLESDYKAFMRPDVDPAARTAALKKLFGDPHFNTMDRLDVYIDDYSIPDPIPAAVLRTLSGARMLGLFDDEEKKAETPTSAPEAAALEAPAPAVPDAPTAAAEAPQPVAPQQPADLPRKPDAA
jgi:hypothetical protein